MPGASPDFQDPTDALDGWRVPPPAPLPEVELDVLLRAGRTVLDEARTARLKARGYDMRDVEDIELREVPPPSAPHVPAIELPAPRPAAAPRLLAQWQPGAWTALARRVCSACADVLQTRQGPVIETHVPQWLCALWLPQGVDVPLLGRWPEMAALVGAETARGALHQLVDKLPPQALLWAAPLEADWALLAELVLHQDADLRPAHSEALRALAEAERSASFARLNDAYACRGGAVRRRS